MDVKIRCEEGCFKYRVAGAVIKDNKFSDNFDYYEDDDA